MPDESDRIRKSAIKTMMNFLLMLSVFHRDTTVEEIMKCHPKMAVVFNHVSKIEDFERTLERMDKYKSLIFDDAVTFYCAYISDETLIGNQKWQDLKKSVMDSESYKEEAWYIDLSGYDKRLLKSLVYA